MKTQIERLVGSLSTVITFDKTCEGGYFIRSTIVTTDRINLLEHNSDLVRRHKIAVSKKLDLVNPNLGGNHSDNPRTVPLSRITGFTDYGSAKP